MGAGASALEAVQQTPTTDDAMALDACGGGNSIMDRICQLDGIDYYVADMATTASRLFAELDTTETGMLDVDNLVVIAVEYFHTQPTVQPEKWCAACDTFWKRAAAKVPHMPVEPCVTGSARRSRSKTRIEMGG